MFLDVFSVPWRDIDLPEVESFVEDASGEGLVWEGKAGAPLPELVHKIRHGVCGLANQLGGIFIVGAAEQSDGSWKLTGVDRGGLRADPHDWLCQIITGRLVNPPPFDVKCWRLENERVVAAIWVEESAAPPVSPVTGLSSSVSLERHGK